MGKLKEEYWNVLSEEYLKRISPYAKITVKERLMILQQRRIQKWN